MALQKWPNRGASNATPAGFMSTRRTQRRSFFIPSPSQIAEPSFVAVDFETAN
ncbi:MAG: DNA polymerase III subunit epsilon, partial [Propionibacteriaceae bacterium]|nr:DNA polymerase III subunit epsilon [Propionibacteriaceae bacterium]